MEPIDFIFNRRSIRKFTSEQVDRQQIDQLLQAAMAAPSAVNSQPWEFIVVDDPAILKTLKKVSLFSNHNAPLAIVVIGSPQKARNPAGGKFWIQDCCAAMENLLLAAVCLGLGAVWIGVHPIQGVEEKVRLTLSIPDTSIPLGIALVGYPAQVKDARTRFRKERVFWQKYGGLHQDKETIK
jgi:nitroreductase